MTSTVSLEALHQMGYLPERCIDCDSRRCRDFECRTPSVVFVSRAQATWIRWDGRLGTVTASDLGLKAGQWPMQIRVQSPRTGHTMLFDQTTRTVKDGDLQSVNYASAGDGLGCWLEVFND